MGPACLVMVFPFRAGPWTTVVTAFCHLSCGRSPDCSRWPRRCAPGAPASPPRSSPIGSASRCARSTAISRRCRTPACRSGRSRPRRRLRARQDLPAAAGQLHRARGRAAGRAGAARDRAAPDPVPRGDRARRRQGQGRAVDLGAARAAPAGRRAPARRRARAAGAADVRDAVETAWFESRALRIVYAKASGQHQPAPGPDPQPRVRPLGHAAQLRRPRDRQRSPVPARPDRAGAGHGLAAELSGAGGGVTAGDTRSARSPVRSPRRSARATIARRTGCRRARTSTRRRG